MESPLISRLLKDKVKAEKHLQERLGKVNSQLGDNEALSREIGDLEKGIGRLQKEVIDIQDQVDAKKSKIRELESKVADAQEHNTLLFKTVETLQRSQESIDRVNQELRAQHEANRKVQFEKEQAFKFALNNL